MTPAETGTALLAAAEPTDRALRGWQPPVWLALGTNAVYRKPFEAMHLPCGWSWKWYEAITGRSPR
jgi:hypothetical protein